MKSFAAASRPTCGCTGIGVAWVALSYSSTIVRGCRIAECPCITRANKLQPCGGAGAVVWFAPGCAAQNALAESGGSLPTLFCSELCKRTSTRERYLGIQPGFRLHRGCQGFDQLTVAAEGTGSHLRHMSLSYRCMLTLSGSAGADCAEVAREAGSTLSTLAGWQRSTA